MYVNWKLHCNEGLPDHWGKSDLGILVTLVTVESETDTHLHFFDKLCSLYDNDLSLRLVSLSY